MDFKEEIKYNEALKRVEKIKGFYTHLIIFVLMNVFFIIIKAQKIDEGESISEVFYVTISWGIGVVLHGLKAFDRLPFLGKNWEEQKIKEYLEVEKRKSNKL